KRLPTVKLAHQSILGNVVGTVGFMPPEQALGRADSVDNRSDIYALGCILYTILCGKPPVQVEDETKIWQALDTVIDGKILPPDQRGSKNLVPKGLSNIAMQAISREPRERFQSVGQLRQAVLDWMHKQAEASIVLVEVEDEIAAAEEDLRQHRPESAQKLLNGAEEKIRGVDGTERLMRSIQSLLERSAVDIKERVEREAVLRAYKDLRAAIVESQFNLVLSHLRLPAPTVRRAHDQLLKALQGSGVWVNPRGMLEKFGRFASEQSEGMQMGMEMREQLIFGLFLFGWASTRMAEVTSMDHGREMFMNHAETAMTRLNELAATYRAPKLILARIKRLRGAHEDADRLEQEARDTPVLSADDYIFLATISFSDYQLEEARDQLLTALSLDPGAFWGHALMIFVCNGLGDQRGAFAALHTCQAMQPREPNLWTMRGFLERELGQFDKAMESLDRALRYGPADTLGRLIRADLRKRMGRIDWQRDLDYAADLVTPPVTTWDHFVLALISLYKNDLEYALEFVRAAQRRSPEMPQLYGLEAAVLVRSGRMEDAEKLFRKALAMAPQDPRLSESLLGLLVYTKRYGEARSKYLIDEEHRPGSSTPAILLLAARAFAGYAGGEKDEETGDTRRALALLEKAAASGTVARVEVDDAQEFSYLRTRPEYRRIYRMLREGPPSPRLFQPSIEDMPGGAGK
ncbi:MAG: tetratricopeptide repeat protein, partial [Planctomycetes bacterium]|nr:tetratricopeptide repeat protein [Planctomycetota bacterium]